MKYIDTKMLITAVIVAIISGSFTLVGAYVGYELGKNSEIDKLERERYENLISVLRKQSKVLKSTHAHTIQWANVPPDLNERACAMPKAIPDNSEQLYDINSEINELIVLADQDLFKLYEIYFSYQSEYMKEHMKIIGELAEAGTPNIEYLQDKYDRMHKAHLDLLLNLSYLQKE